MMKRIISLILVVALSVVVLASCAYKYERDDMSKYATFDKAKFLEALQNLEITDADFTADPEVREDKVSDKIFAEIAKKTGTDAKFTEGTIGTYDVLYYCYYVTAVIDGENHLFYASSMEEAKATSLQIGLSTLKEYEQLIATLVCGKDIKDYLYSTSTELKDNTETEDVNESLLKAGDVIYVSYTKKVTSTDAEGAVSTNTSTVSYDRIVLAEGAESLAGKLIGKTVSTTALPDTFEFGTEGDKQEYSNITIHWLVNSENEIGTVTYKPTATITAKNLEGKDFDLKDVELTYHIFPVYAIDIPETPTVEFVLENYYTNLIATDSRVTDSTKYVFAALDAGFKNGDTTLLDLVNTLIENRKELTTAEKTQSDAQSVVTKAGQNATEAEKQALEDAKAATEAAKAKVKETTDKILACTNDKGEDVKEALVKGLYDYIYYGLEVAYEQAIVKSIATEIFALAKQYITYKTEDGNAVLPKKAVKQAYERIENAHKLEFYTGNKTSSSTSGSTDEEAVTNYKYYGGDYEAFLMTKYPSAKSIDDVKKQITAKAEQAVRDVVFVYVLKEALDSVDLSVSKDQKEEFKLQGGYWLLEYQYGDNFTENDYMPALVFDNIFNYLLERGENDGVKLVFKHVKYSFKTEEE